MRGVAGGIGLEFLLCQEIKVQHTPYGPPIPRCPNSITDGVPLSCWSIPQSFGSTLLATAGIAADDCHDVVECWSIFRMVLETGQDQFQESITILLPRIGCEVRRSLALSVLKCEVIESSALDAIDQAPKDAPDAPNISPAAQIKVSAVVDVRFQFLYGVLAFCQRST